MTARQQHIELDNWKTFLTPEQIITVDNVFRCSGIITAILVAKRLATKNQNEEKLARQQQTFSFEGGINDPPEQEGEIPHDPG